MSARRASWIGSLLIGAGCAGAPPEPPRVKPKPVAVESITPAIVSPAHWDYHPPAPDSALGSARIGERGCLITAEGGQRWVSAGGTEKDSPPEEESGARLCAGKAEASSFLAPEELAGIVRRGEKSWLFVGESGTLYLAGEPLGAFSRTIAPPEPFHRVSGAGSFVLGTTFEGKLLRWEEATGWKPVVVSAAPGRMAPRLFDVSVRESGRALGLSFPEALFTSDDGGASWAPLGAPPIGARAVGLNAEGELTAQGLLESLVLPSSKGAAPRKIHDGLSTASTTLELSAGRGATAAAVLAGRAAMDGDRYVEAIRPDSEGDDWTLSRGRIEGRLESAPLAGTGACGSVKLGLRGKSLFLACVSQVDGDIHAAIRRSVDVGSTFGEPLELIALDTDQVVMAVSPGGSALITGACKAAPAEASGTCRPGAPLLVQAEGDGKLKATLIGAPQLSAQAQLPAFSADGHSAYFLGRRGKDDKITLFVSHDAGESFSPRPLDTPAARVARRPPRSDEDEEGEGEGEVDVSDDALEIDESSFLRAGEDGTLGLMCTRPRGSSYLTLDEDGRVQQAAVPPSEDALITGVGKRVVAFAYNDSRDPPLTFWESLDGGATWDEQPASPALGRELTRASLSMICSPSGCLFGDQLTRVGWGGQVDGSATDRTPPSPPPAAPSVLTPIVCELAPKTAWARIEHVYGANAHAAPLPDLNEIFRGRSIWSVLTDDPSGAIGTLSASLPESGDGEPVIVTHALLGRRPAGESATDVSRQMEGYAAVRVALSVEKNGELKAGAPMRNVEIGWANFMEGSVGHAKIPDAGAFEPDDVAGDRGERTLSTTLTTVMPHGILVTPHGQRARNRASYLFDTAGKMERVELPVFPSTGLHGQLDLRTDAVWADARLVAVGMTHDSIGETTGLLLGRRSSAPGGQSDRWDLVAHSLLPGHTAESPLLTHTDWTYAGKAIIGITSLVADRQRPRAWAYFQAFHGDGSLGAPEPQATLLDLGDRPRPCAAADRASSPRFESLLFARGEPLFPGMRHPVLVSEPPAKPGALPSTPLVLLTAAAIAHGPPSSPCVAGWEARGLARSAITAVLAGDLRRAWLFRVAAPGTVVTRPGATTPSAALEYRPMVCRYDPSARVPEAVWSEPGTAAVER